jgi:hypothetical protein
MDAASAITPSRLARANRLIAQFSHDWRQEFPHKLHTYGPDDGHGLGGPAFHPDFIRFLGNIPHVCSDGACRNEMRRNEAGRNHDSRTRTTRAFRKVRRVAPREFDVLYLLCVLSYSVDDVVRALNQRAERLEKPERYDRRGVTYLALSGLDKASRWY